MTLAPLHIGQTVIIDVSAIGVRPAISSKNSLFEILAEKAAASYGVDAATAYNALTEREAIGSTGFGNASAIPHAKIPNLRKCSGLFIKLDESMPFEAHDDKPVDLIFCLLSPENSGADHLKALASISRFLRDDGITAKLRGAVNSEALYVLLSDQHTQQAA